MKRPLWKVIRPWHGLTIIALLIFGCQDKDGNFFVPDPFGGPPIQLTDITLPRIENLRPATNIILSEREISFDVFDPPGASGEPVSGINPAVLRALFGTQALPVVRVGTGNTYNVDISSIGEGQRAINYEAFDLAGNRAIAIQSFTTDWTAPTLTWSGSNTGTTSQATTTINLTGNYTDLSGLTVADLYVRQLVNGQCLATGDLVPTGTAPGTVTTNRYSLGLNVSTFNLGVNYNAPNNPRPFTSSLCFHYHGEDAARGRMGSPRPNVTDRTWRFDQTWAVPPVSEGTITGRVRVNNTVGLQGITVSTPGKPSTTTDANGNYNITNVPAGSATVAISNIPTDVQCAPLSKVGTVIAAQTITIDFDCVSNFNLSLQMAYVHVGPGVSYSCVTIVGAAASIRGEQPVVLENIAGASFTVQWSGPGTVGSTQRSGSLNAQSQALDRQQINQFGTYNANVSVTHRGLTKQATGSVAVGGTQGTCTPP